MKEEVSITLGKREEKLKKKERQLDEEMTAREKLEKEVKVLYLFHQWRTFSSQMAARDLLLSYKLSESKSSEILWNEPTSIGFISRCLRNTLINLDRIFFYFCQILVNNDSVFQCDDLRKQCSSLETLSKRQEQAISKKE